MTDLPLSYVFQPGNVASSSKDTPLVPESGGLSSEVRIEVLLIYTVEPSVHSSKLAEHMACSSILL